MRRGLATMMAIGLLVGFFAVPARPAAAVPSERSSAVLADNPSAFWRLNEPSGTVAVDSSLNSSNGTYSGTPVYGAAGSDAQSTDTAMGPGSLSMIQDATVGGPQVFSVEVWFKTSTASGGRIAGFSNGSSNDRSIAVDNAGHVIFGVYPGSAKRIQSSSSYTDNQWHFAAATLSAAGMSLYVDGQLVGSNATVTSAQGYNGSWVLGSYGAFSTSAWSNSSTNSFMYGSYDDFAVWNTTALTQAQISTHYATRGASNQVGTVVDPALSFTVAGRATACRGETPNATTSSTSIDFGRVNTASRAVAAQNVTVTANAGNGWSIYQRMSGPISDGRGNTIPNITPGINPFPALGTAGFGTALDWFGSNTWMALGYVNGGASFADGIGTSGVSRCVVYQLQTSSTTPAGSYSTSLIYTVVPSF